MMKYENCTQTRSRSCHCGKAALLGPDQSAPRVSVWPWWAPETCPSRVPSSPTLQQQLPLGARWETRPTSGNSARSGPI